MTRKVLSNTNKKREKHYYFLYDSNLIEKKVEKAHCQSDTHTSFYHPKSFKNIKIEY